MTISPRGLLVAAPALLVLAGSFLMARMSANAVNRTQEKSHDSHELVSLPTEEDEECLHRVGIKLETVDDLLAERITFEEAVLRFASLAGSRDEFQPATSTLTDSSLQRNVEQVLSFARTQARYEPGHYNLILTRIEKEATLLLGEAAGKDDPGIVR